MTVALSHIDQIALVVSNVDRAESFYGGVLGCADIARAVRELTARGLVFDSKPHLIAKVDDRDLWMAFFRDRDGHASAPMQEAPKEYVPQSS
ncbi:MAG: VOC family protein [Acidobacteriota bacterium]